VTGTDGTQPHHIMWSIEVYVKISKSAGFLPARCPSCCQTNNVKALKETESNAASHGTPPTGPNPYVIRQLLSKGILLCWLSDVSANMSHISTDQSSPKLLHTDITAVVTTTASQVNEPLMSTA